MAVNESIPFRKPGAENTAVTSAAVTGKRFVQVSGTPTLIGDNPTVAHATAAGPAYGVAAYDAASGDTVLVHTGPGLEVPVTAKGAITAGAQVEVGTAGVASTLAAGVAVGLAVTTAADGADVRVKIR